MHNLIDAIVDAADAPHLRAQVAELEAAVTRLTAENTRQAQQIERLKLDVKFYYESFTGKQLKIAENAWGLPGGG